ncbi:hypothetical protein ABBQ32_011521 [Trebouxia sp. C0010 RCD-2024]
MGEAATVAFASLADAHLVIEGIRLPVHSTILAANSDILAQIFAEATAQHPTQRQLEVPLPGDSLRDVSTALRYFYKGCTVWLANALEISEALNTISLAKFAHKYGIEPLLQACQDSLIIAVQLNPESAGSETLRTQYWTIMAQVVDVAETCGMWKRLAHCEFCIIANEHSDFWTHPAMLSDQVSKHSLLRMLRSFKHVVSMHQPIIATTWCAGIVA